MTTMSAFAMRKPKKQVYGKANSRSNWNIDAFFDDDEVVVSEPNYVATRIETSSPASQPVKIAESPKVVLATTRPPPKRQDTFDVPSSDDERTSPVRMISTGFQVRNTLVDDTDSSFAEFAPWERKKPQPGHSNASKRGRVEPASPDAQLRQDLERAASLSPIKTRPSLPLARSTGESRNTINLVLSPKKQTFSDTSSAVARLAARRNEEAHTLPKRAALATDESESTPQKRPRTSRSLQESEDDIVMIEEPTVLRCDMPQASTQRIEQHADEQSVDIYAFPASSDDELPTFKTKAPIMKPVAKPSRRGKSMKYSARTQTKKGLSAPARLAEMLSTDTDTTEPLTRSPSTTSRRSTPQKTPSTPLSAKASSPDSTLRTRTRMTPKQTKLWSQLLPSDPIVPSPSALALRELSISAKQPTGANAAARRFIKSQSDVAAQRMRLVDRLKASAPTSDDELSEEEEDVSVQAMNDNIVDKKAARQEAGPATLDRKPSQISQSQSQSVSTGPKITYSSVRSYLPEENVEEDFMAGLEPEAANAHVHTKNTRKPVSTSQQSTFDFDGSDEDGDTHGGIRTIHELRASGRNISGMYDIQELLADIQNHNASHRSRRRSALIELATKLIDKDFAKRLIAQSLESEIAGECGAASDEVADFVVAVIVTLILSAECPDHTVKALHDQAITKWLAKLLNRDISADKLVKDRSSNMSKAAQTSFVAFVDRLKKLSSLWGKAGLDVMTTRLVALKALDLLISKLRCTGEKSELMATEQVALVLPDTSESPNTEKPTDLALSISVLESLSTTAAALQWPSSTIKTIGGVLLRLNIGSPQSRHSFFLMLRLCLNLTNDNVRNCDILARADVVPFLLVAIKEGFGSLETDLDDEKRALSLDVLVLCMGIMINLTERSDLARGQATQDEEVLSALISIFKRGHEHMLDAESVDESVSNVAFGYLAVMLSNICQTKEAKTFIASKLPGKNLSMLIEAVDEFVAHHQKVDTMNFDGEEGAEVWGVFTEKLKAVLARLKDAELDI